MAGDAGDLSTANGGARADVPFVSLYRRFRPGRFAELRGQTHVVRALQGAVRDGRVSHAYLFSGPRGTGKTSSARILARALNCASPDGGEPCGVCPSCIEIVKGTSLDVHELDAASNNGVDAMRDLISHAALATPGRWKVYIVDEVHMLSNAAANALLKTLEEPPGHVVFVLATTDPQKVPATIKSRTQHLEFGLLGSDTLAGLLHDVNAAAGLDLEEADLSVAVRKGRGSARDALSALDQVVASGSAEALRPHVVPLTRAIAEEDARSALVEVAALHDSGWGPQQIVTELVDELRQTFLVSLAPELCAATGPERERLAAQATTLGLATVVRAIETIGRAQVDMRDAPDGRVVLEIALVRLSRPSLDDSTEALADRVTQLERAFASGVTAHPGSPGPPPARTVPARPATSTTPGDDPSSQDRPTLGALRRQRAMAAPGAESPAPDTAPPMPEPALSAPDTAPPARPGTGEATTEEATTEEATTEEATTDDSVATVHPDRDMVVQAWGDHVLRGLPARAKALYSPGRFVTMEGETATFALPNAAHRDRCEEVRSDVERAIGAHFGSTIRLQLTVDSGALGPATARTTSPAASPTPATEVPGLDPGDEIDPVQPTGSVESVAEARLLEAFPGAEEVRG